MPWTRTPPKEPGHYWFRRGLSVEPRVVRLGYPGLSRKLLDCNARAGDPMTPGEMLNDHPHAMFWFPVLEPPRDVKNPPSCAPTESTAERTLTKEK